MDYVLLFFDFFLHLDKHLAEIIAHYGAFTYAILFLIIFCETGLVITPFLPGDSLLFAAGAFAVKGALGVWQVVILLSVAAILGDTVNYWIGHLLAPRIFRGDKIRFLKQEHLDRTHQFFEKYGGKTIIIARFVPIVRTFAPFVAGVGSMSYRKFIAYNVIGGILWVFLLTFAGYFFGTIPAVENNFSLVILVIIIISMLPGVYEYWRHRREIVRAAAGMRTPRF